MTYLKMLPSNISSDFSIEDLYKGSFIEKDVKDYFDDYLYIKTSDSNEDRVVYIFSNSKNRGKKTVIQEFFKSLSKVKSKGWKNITGYIYHDDKLYNIIDFLRKCPLDTETYSPVLEHLSRSIDNTDDLVHKNSMKIGVFSELIKFIAKDDDLLSLLKTIV